MTRFVAFLRGINLGKRRVENDELRGHFEAMGLEGVATFLASGNVVFDDPGEDRDGLERRIESHLGETLGFPVATLVRGLDELDRLLDLPAVTAGEEERLSQYVIFLREEAGSGIREALDALEGPDDRFHVLGREVLWQRRGGISDAPSTSREREAALGPDRTRRSLNTVRRIVAKFGA